MTKFEELVNSSRTLLGNAKVHVDGTIAAYTRAEAANVDDIVKVWSALEADPGIQPIGPAPDGSATRGDLPSAVLVFRSPTA